MSWITTVGTRFITRPIDEDLAWVCGTVKSHPKTVVVGLGIFLRLVVYLSGRPFWMDEGSLWGNLAGRPILDFSAPLAGDQLAPLGFLVAQRAIMSLFGVSTYASRILPLCCGLLAIVLFARLCCEVLSPEPRSLRWLSSLSRTTRFTIRASSSRTHLTWPSAWSLRWLRSMPSESQCRGVEGWSSCCWRSLHRGAHLRRHSSSRVAA